MLNDKIFSLDEIFAEDARLKEKLEGDILVIEKSTALQKTQSDKYDSKIMLDTVVVKMVFSSANLEYDPVTGFYKLSTWLKKCIYDSII